MTTAPATSAAPTSTRTGSVPAAGPGGSGSLPGADLGWLPAVAALLLLSGGGLLAFVGFRRRSRRI